VASVATRFEAWLSASYAVANAVNAKSLQSASYAAYALVYAQGGYGAVAQHEAFDSEFSWQLSKLKSLASEFMPDAAHFG
jgi:hypothetical protein